ncbi:unnamed protein product, partial [Nesidiocoris tenuis]
RDGSRSAGLRQGFRTFQRRQDEDVHVVALPRISGHVKLDSPRGRSTNFQPPETAHKKGKI